MPLAVLCRRVFIETEIETFNVEVVMVHLVFSGSCGFFGGEEGVLKVAFHAEVLRGSSRVPTPHVYAGGYSGSEREKTEERAFSHVLGTSRLCRPPPWFPVD